MDCVRRVALTLCLLLLAGSQSALAQPASDGFDPALKQPPWQRLGPIGPRTVNVLAVSPELSPPRDKLLLAARNRSPGHAADLVRSRDGGQTWQALPSPAEQLAGMQLALAPGGASVAFAWSDSSIFRSDDAGSSWQAVLAPETGGIARVVLSPAMAQDGLGFVLASGVLWRSNDAGLSWSALEPVAGQYVQQVRLSPEFASDKTVFVALAGGPLPTGTLGTQGFSAPGGDPDTSAGVAVSTDAGDSWTLRNEGLQVDGQPYQAVEDIEVSPTFARDGTLFAFGWGPFESVSFGVSDAPSQRATLFRSQDGGLTWQPIQTFGPMLGRIHLQVAASPTFADDGIVLEAMSVSGPTPASSHCSVAFSDDGGDTWTEKLRPGSYEGCQFLQTFGAGGGFEATVLKSYTRYWSPDGGRTWGLASTPAGFQPIVPSPAYALDRTLFIGGDAGVWANGPGVVATNGMVPCDISPVLGFGRTWGGNIDVRAALGCASEEERPVTLRLREYTNQYCGPTRVLWVDDPAYPEFYELSDAGCGPKSLSRWQKETAASRLPDVREEVIQGVVEPFEGGIMVFVPRADGTRTILVLQSNDRWTEYPDT